MAKRTRHHSTARDYPRTARLNRLFQEILAEELERIDDERLELVTVMSVDCDASLERAIVYYESLGGVDDDEVVLEALAEARPRLRSAVGRQARVKRTPELLFRPDDVVRGARRVEDLLRGLPEPEPEPEPDAERDVDG
jgi:ribosome-binding factor A